MPHRLFNKSNNGTCRLTLTVLCSMIGALLVCYLIAFGHVINGGALLKALQEHYHEQPPQTLSLLRRQISSSLPTNDASSESSEEGTSKKTSVISDTAESSSTKSTSSSLRATAGAGKADNKNIVVLDTNKAKPAAKEEQNNKVIEQKNQKQNALNIQIDLSVLPKTFLSRNLILGIASNIDAKNFAIFCQSLRWNRIDATVIIFLERGSGDNYKHIQEIGRENQIILLEYSVKEHILAPTFLQTYHASSLRWVLYHWLLDDSNHPQWMLSSSFDKMITVDVRDTAFQSDPFTLITANTTELMTIGENIQSSIGACTWNSGWIKDCFGERILRLIKSFPIICSGITLGGRQGMTNYIQKMGKILLNDYSCFNTNFPLCERNGVDQGVHNVLVYMGQLEPASIRYPNDFPVTNIQSALALGSIKEMTVPNSLSSGGSVLDATASSSPVVRLPVPTAATTPTNPIKPIVKTKQWMMSNGSPYAIVHQYDRNPDLQLAYAKRYVNWIDFDNPVNEWKSTSTCKNYGVVFGVDLLKGKCDLTSQRVLTPASCCELCSGINTKQAESGSLGLKCSAFTYAAGTCYMKSCSYETDIAPIIKLVQDPNFRDMTITQPDTTSAYLLP